MWPEYYIDTGVEREWKAFPLEILQTVIARWRLSNNNYSDAVNDDKTPACHLTIISTCCCNLGGHLVNYRVHSTVSPQILPCCYCPVCTHSYHLNSSCNLIGQCGVFLLPAEQIRCRLQPVLSFDTEEGLRPSTVVARPLITSGQLQ